MLFTPSIRLLNFSFFIIIFFFINKICNTNYLNLFQNSVSNSPSLCENVEQDVSKTEVIDSMDTHNDGLFTNQLNQLNQLVNTNEIIVSYI